MHTCLVCVNISINHYTKYNYNIIYESVHDINFDQYPPIHITVTSLYVVLIIMESTAAILIPVIRSKLMGRVNGVNTR